MNKELIILECKNNIINIYQRTITIIKNIPVGIPIVLTTIRNSSILPGDTYSSYKPSEKITTLCIVRNLFVGTMQLDIIASSKEIPITHPVYTDIITWKKLTKKDMPLYVNLNTKRPLFFELMKDWNKELKRYTSVWKSQLIKQYVYTL